MTEIPPPGTAAVVDRRAAPSGVLPHGIQTWLMVGLALGIVLVILLTGRSQPTVTRPAGAVAGPVSTPSPTRMREVQEQLKLIDARARQQAALDATTPAAAVARGLPEQPTAAAAPPPPDPIAEERKRREYNSLFASNVVASRRPAAMQPVGGTSEAWTRRSTVAADMNGSSKPPTIDDAADAVLRASARLGTPTAGGAAPVGAPAVPTPAPATAQTLPGAVAGGRQTTPARTDPITAAGPLHRLLEGTVIDAVLTNRLDGSSASPVNALVTNPIYSHHGEYVLIPAGARVLGDTKPVQNFGEARLAVGFHRLLFPDGSTISLEQFKGLNQVGDNGLHDQVNNHYLSTFGAAAAVGLITGLSQYLGNVGFTNGNGERTVVIAGGVGNATTQATTQVMNHFLNRLPTITIREGTRIKVYVTSDLDLPAYAPPALGGRIPGDNRGQR